MNYYIIPGLKNESISGSRYEQARAVIRRTADHFCVDLTKMLTKGRETPYSYARQLATYIIRRNIGLRLRETQKILFEGIDNPAYNDHTGVVAATATIEGFIKIGDEQAISDLEAIWPSVRYNVGSVKKVQAKTYRPKAKYSNHSPMGIAS